MKLADKIKQLPLTPGVYLMKDTHGEVIYVGKSKSLRQRVQSYFRGGATHTSKVRKLVTHIRDLDIIETDTEFEALLLEWQLIQEIRPTFNRQMKTPEAFVYLTVRKVGKLLRMRLSTHPLQGEDGWSFGPYSSKKGVNFALLGLREMYRLQCSNPAINGSPCLNYSLGLCRGICLGGKAVDEHNEIVRRFVAMLQGESNELLTEVEQKMQKLAEDLAFEKAATYRNYFHAFLSLLQKEEVKDFTEGNQQFLVVEKLADGKWKVFVIWRTDVLFSRVYEDTSKVVADVRHTLETAPPIRSHKVNRFEIDKAHIIYRYLRSGECKYAVLGKDEAEELDAVVEKLLL
ncbi:UvrABC system protein C [Bacillus sp. THAF10]|nr:UvrABC system protein C [Bacillus sp. THAF10]